MTIERKTFRIEAKATGDAGEFEAVIATLNTVDHDGDIIVPGAFGNATISVVPTHDHSSVPLGKATMEDRGNLAVAKGRFNLDIPAAKDWHSALKFDLAHPPAVQEWSFAFRVLDSEEETRDGQPVRILKNMDVMEISPVLRGAGVGTATLSVKATFEKQLEKTLAALSDTLERAKQVTALRAAKDKPKALPDERKAQLEAVRSKWAELDAALSAGDDAAGKTTLAERVQAVKEEVDTVIAEVANARAERVKNDRELSAETCAAAAELAGSAQELQKALAALIETADKASGVSQEVTQGRINWEAHKARYRRLGS